MSKLGKQILFSGPTLYRALSLGKPQFADFVVLPPVQRGDVQRVLATSADRPGLLVLVDGLFHLNHLAVGHAEIRLAIERGFQVWGLSSMGAIRACEMREQGMQGFGSVFEMYAQDPDFRDDEVTLLHEPQPPYRAVSEPLVHIRAGLAQLRQRGVLSAADEHSIVEHLMGLWFGDRTLSLVEQLVNQRVPGQGEVVRAWLRTFDEFQLKSLDLLNFLARKPWQTV